MLRLSENTHLPFDRPFDGLTVLSTAEGLTAQSEVEGLRYSPSLVTGGQIL
jgi:hypothetical protein